MDMPDRHSSGMKCYLMFSIVEKNYRLCLGGI